ncbi:MAG TPA: hypothetical protein VNE61_08690 [Ktedonobacteraceae bacterium]|nr:hypothetical protein [Ktedonobacteraceae bacterium]
MSYTLWTFFCLAAYSVGIVVLLLVTPRLLRYSYDQPAFTGFAALEIVGGLCVFGAVTITYGLFSGSFAIEVLDFLLLAGILVVGSALSYRSFRSRQRDAVRATRVIAGIFCLLLVLAAIYYLALLFGA